MGIFQEQEASSLRPVGIAIAIAMLTLFIIFILLLIVGVFIRRRAERQQAAVARTPSTQRTFLNLQICSCNRDLTNTATGAPHASLFPLSLPSFRSKHNFTASSSTERMRVPQPLYKEFSDIDLEAQAMPLPPPPSYQEITMMGPVRSISGSSWVTEGPTVVEEPATTYSGRRGSRGVMRHAGRSSRRL